MNRIINMCDGKQCGLGKYAGGGSYVCPHKNLKVEFPSLADQWDYTRNSERPENFLSKSNKNMWWTCLDNKCGCHVWKATISNRTRDITKGCPFCNISKVCPHNNFLINNPDLAKEWDYEKNQNRPEEYANNSNIKVWWKCSISSCQCHVWETSIYKRQKGGNCPYCVSKKLCQHNNLAAIHPEITEEWCWEKNNSTPYTYAPHSSSVVWWNCSKNRCGCHKWQAAIQDRTGKNKTGCPFCNKGQPCEHNNLAILRPDLTVEWDYEKNNDPPQNYSIFSNKEVYWKCSKAQCHCHKWVSSISNRSSGKNCPYCSSHKICPHNNFAFLCPDLLLEWDHNNNSILPSEVSLHSGIIVSWKCDKQHKWKTSIKHRVSGTGCPQCTTSRGYSVKQIEWIKNIMREENILIQHAESEQGEYFIEGIGKVDGFCMKTNTVFEYHGDFWHGNPNIYKQDVYHPVIKDKTFGDIYAKTLQRDKQIKQKGYNLIVKWETDAP